jgi:hypothetical protein
MKPKQRGHGSWYRSRRSETNLRTILSFSPADSWRLFRLWPRLGSRAIDC